MDNPNWEILLGRLRSVRDRQIRSEMVEEQDIERLIGLLEQKYLTRRLDISEGRNIMLVALVIKAGGTTRILFEAFMIQFLNPTTEQVEEAREYITSFKDQL